LIDVLRNIGIIKICGTGFDEFKELWEMWSDMSRIIYDISKRNY